MKKISKQIETKIAIILTVLVMIFALVIDVFFAFKMFEQAAHDELAKVTWLILGIPILTIITILSCTPSILIWSIWGIVKLIKKRSRT